MKRHNECIWMTAGISPYRECIHEYECFDCPYDRAMQKWIAKGEIESWRDVMRRNHADSKWCRHMLSNVVSYKICIHDYHCVIVNMTK